MSIISFSLEILIWIYGKSKGQKSRKSKELGFVNFKMAKDAQRVRDATDRRVLNEKLAC